MIVAALFSLFVYSQDCEVPGYTQEFDRHFRNAVLFYWPQQQQDWCNLKAQGIVESDLRLHAVSPVGAQCIMQIMPSTENDLIRHTGMVGNIFEARYCINMGALYMSWLFDYFVFERTDECRTGVALPAYNTGAGHIDEGQVLSGGERCWPGIAPFLHLVTGRHSEETINYVKRWCAIREQMGDGKVYSFCAYYAGG